MEEAGLALDALQAQHLAEELGEQLLHGPPGGAAGGGRIIICVVQVQRGEGLAVQLAGGGEGKGGTQHPARGHHVRGQDTRQPVLERLGGDVGGSGHHPGDEPGVARPPTLDGDGGGAHSGQGGQGGFHLAQLHAHAAHLHLQVGARDELEHAGGQPASQVAGAVQSRTGLGAEGVRHEALGGEVRTAHVATRHAQAAQVQLTHHARRHGLERVVQDVHLHVGLGRANGGEGASRRPVQEIQAGDVRVLRGAVGIRHAALRAALHPRAAQRGRHGLATERHPAHVREGAIGTRALQDVLEDGGHHLHDGGSTLPQRLGQARRVSHHVILDEVRGATTGQGAQHLPDGDVEAERGNLREDVPLPQPQRVAHAQQVVEHAAVVNHHPLGRTGGAGGEQHVGEALGRGTRRQASRALRLQPLQRQHARTDCLGHLREHLRQQRLHRPEREDERRAALREQCAQPCGRELCVQGQICSTRLVQRQQRAHGGFATPAQHGHHRLRFHVLRHQPPRGAVRPRLQLRVRPPHATGRGQRHGLRGAHGLVGEVLVERRFQREGTARRAGCAQYARTLRVRQQRQRVDARAWSSQRMAQQVEVVPQQPPDGGALEEVGAVAGEEVEAGLALEERQVQVELARPRVERHVASGRAREGVRQRVLHAEQVEHHLEQGRLAGVPLHAERLDEPLEGQVLVGQRLQRGAPRLREQCGEGVARRHARAQHHGVHEQADEPLGCGVGASGDGSADAEVVLARVAVQQRGERGVQHHERSDLVLTAERAERPHERRRQREPLRQRAPVGTQRGPRQIGGQLQAARGVVELPLPVREQLRLPSRRGRGVLPCRDIRVLQGQGRQGRGLAPGERGVKHAQLAHQHVDGRAIRDEVVEHQHQQVPVRRGAQQPEAVQRPTLQVEGA